MFIGYSELPKTSAEESDVSGSEHDFFLSANLGLQDGRAPLRIYEMFIRNQEERSNINLFSCKIVRIRDGHADADRMLIRNMSRIYRAISDICRIMRIYPHRFVSANISAWPSLV